jgi:hypothetical protein
MPVLATTSTQHTKSVFRLVLGSLIALTVKSEMVSGAGLYTIAKFSYPAPSPFTKILCNSGSAVPDLPAKFKDEMTSEATEIAMLRKRYDSIKIKKKNLQATLEVG